jgi:hypothetical protein
LPIPDILAIQLDTPSVQACSQSRSFPAIAAGLKPLRFWAGQWCVRTAYIASPTRLEGPRSLKQEWAVPLADPKSVIQAQNGLLEEDSTSTIPGCHRTVHVLPPSLAATVFPRIQDPAILLE